MRLVLCSLLLAACPSTEDLAVAPTPAQPPAEPAPAAAAFDHTHALWTEVLAAHVAGDDFDYGALAKDRTQLDAYVGTLQAVTSSEVASWSEKQRFAFWINVYNAYTILKVVDNYPLQSIRKLDKAFGITTVFEQEWIPMTAFDPDGDGDELSLNDVEHEILRKEFLDARLHAAVNCASASCPPLRGEAFVADRLDAQLEEQMRGFVNDSKRNVLDEKNRRLRLSEIFKWFEGDFERDAKTIKGYLKRFLAEDQHDFVDQARIEYLDYDWDLNDTQ